MRIEDLASNIARPYAPKTGAAAGKEGGAGAIPAAGAVDRADRVSISDEARALAIQDSQRVETVLSERLAAIRERVLSGAYDSLEAVELLSRRILATGEV